MRSIHIQLQQKQKIDEDTYKEVREAEGLPYIANGSRDKFGNMRKNVGGRKPKALRDRAGVAGGKSSKRRTVADERRREFTAPEALQLNAEVES